MAQNGVSAPTTGQNGTFPRPPQDLVHISGTATVINVPSTAPTHVGARIRDRYVQYTSDPRADAGTPGLWRTAGDGIRELISPFALQRITLGRHGIEIWVVLPRTGETRLYEGSLDQIASAIHRAGIQIGCRAERKLIFWALTEFCRRQQAARGAC
jgi:hypothetical protein